MSGRVEYDGCGLDFGVGKPREEDDGSRRRRGVDGDAGVVHGFCDAGVVHGFCPRESQHVVTTVWMDRSASQLARSGSEAVIVTRVWRSLGEQRHTADTTSGSGSGSEESNISLQFGPHLTD